jgi:hypothetical protein
MVPAMPAARSSVRNRAPLSATGCPDVRLEGWSRRHTTHTSLRGRIRLRRKTGNASMKMALLTRVPELSVAILA